MDDAVGCLRAIERRRGGALEHLDALDVVGIEIVEAVGGRTTRERAAGDLVPDTLRVRPFRRARIDADAVDVHDWTLAQAEAGGPTNAEIARCPGAATDAHRAQTGDLRRQRLSDVGDGDLLLHLRHVDDAHRRADLPFLDGAASSGDHDLIELDRALCERERDARRVIAGEGDGRDLRPKSDA